MVLLGAVIEKISGMSYPDYLQRHIFTPAGLIETALAQEHDVLPGRSIGYSPRPGGGYQANVRAVMPASADGGMRTSAMDLLRFDQALHGNKLLNAKLHQQMITPIGPVPFMASGWFVNRIQDRQLVGHGGGAPGVSAEFRRYLDDGYTLVVLSNYDDGASPLTEQIEKILFGLPVQMPSQADADYSRAQHFQRTGQTEAALILFDQLAGSKSAHLPSLYAGARLRIISKTEPEKAVQALAQYIATASADTTPSLSAAWWRKGNAYELLGKVNEARQCYEQALKLNPDEHEAAKSLAALNTSK